MPPLSLLRSPGCIIVESGYQVTREENQGEFHGNAWSLEFAVWSVGSDVKVLEGSKTSNSECSKMEELGIGPGFQKFLNGSN